MRQTSRTGTTKNSAGNSISQSIQSPISRVANSNFEEIKKKNAFNEDNSNNTNLLISKGRNMYNSKLQKKSIKKVISIPTVKIDKKFEKEQKKLKRTFCMSDTIEMDVIAENQDVSETDTISVKTKSNKKKQNEKYQEKDMEGNSRKVIVSKINKETKITSNKKENEKDERIKHKKIKKKKQNINNNVNNSTNANWNEICGQEESLNIRRNSYQSKNESQNDYFSSDSKTINKEIDEADILKGFFKPEIEMQPNKYTVQSCGKNSVMEQGKKDEYDNTELFSSKKFNDIMSKHKKFTRYIDENEADSMLDINSHRKSNEELHVIDVFDDKDIIEQSTNQKSKKIDNKFLEKTPISDNFDRIKKVEITDSKKSKELKYEDLCKSKKSYKNYENQSNNSNLKSSICQKSIDRIFTTSINLMDYDQMSPQKLADNELINCKTQDDRDDSLMKPPNWELSSFKKPVMNYDDVLGK